MHSEVQLQQHALCIRTLKPTMQCKDQMKTQQSLYVTFTDLQALATDSAGQVKMLQQAVHIKELLQVLPRN